MSPVLPATSKHQIIRLIPAHAFGEGFGDVRPLRHPIAASDPVARKGLDAVTGIETLGVGLGYGPDYRFVRLYWPDGLSSEYLVELA